MNNISLQDIFEQVKLILSNLQEEDVKEGFDINSLEYLSHINSSNYYKKVSDRLFDFMIAKTGADSQPKVVNDGVFDKLEGSCFYHGFSEKSYGRQFLQDEFYTRNMGDVAGFCVTPNKNTALYFTGYWTGKAPNEDNVLKMKIAQSKGVYLTYLYRAFSRYVFDSSYLSLTKRSYELRENINSKYKLIGGIPRSEQDAPPEDAQKLVELKHFINSIRNNYLRNVFVDALQHRYSIIALYLGYDYIAWDKDDNYEMFTILNRGNVIVPESSNLIFTDSSFNHNDGFNKC